MLLALARLVSISTSFIPSRLRLVKRKIAKRKRFFTSLWNLVSFDSLGKANPARLSSYTSNYVYFIVVYRPLADTKEGLQS